jgi:hypothetical protein
MRFSARIHPGQSLRNITQKNLSDGTSRGCGRFCLNRKAISEEPGFPKAGRGESKTIE